MNPYQISKITEDVIPKTTLAAQKAFGPLVSLILPKKKIWGFYAHDQDDVVGAVYIKKVAEDEGVLDWVFIDPKAQGFNLASHLMDAGVLAMDEAGLRRQFALVRDDNTASWNMFAKRGYKEASLFYTLTKFRLKSLPNRVTYSMVTGYSIWVKDERLDQAPIHPKKFAILKTFLLALFIGASLSLFSLRGIEYFIAASIMVPLVTLVRMMVSYPVVRMFGKVRWDAPQGGLTISVFVSLLGTWWPTFGSFVPDEDVYDFRKYAKYDVFAQFLAWMSLLGLYLLSFYYLGDLFKSALQFYFMFIIIVQAFPFFPLDGMPGARIFRFNKLVYLTALIFTIMTFIIF